MRAEDRPAPFHPATELRGFTIGGKPEAFPEILKEAVEKWNINIARYWFRKTPGAWEKQLALLPGHLDAAKKLGVRMVIVGEVPPFAEAAAQYPQAQAQWQHAYWTDESSLQALVEGWKKIATVCKDREEEIWFDLVNEPLDRTDMPSYPKNWPRWAQTVVNEIRKIDPKHPIVISTGPGGLVTGMTSFPVLRGKPLIYQIHVYVPHEFTHQGVQDIRNTDLAKAYLERQKAWPGNFADGNTGGFWDKHKLEEALEPAIEFQRRNPDIPIYVGEFSVARWAPGGAQYLKDCVEIFEQHGWDWTYHGFKDSPIWSLEHTNEYSDSQHAVISTTLPDRAEVLKPYLDQNRRANTGMMDLSTPVK
ncbi:MAG: glycoside hydrolase family 5 protein [Chthoniobacteraceae bacterium]